MRKLVMTIVGVAALCGMTAFAQTAPTTPPTTPAVPEDHAMRAHRESEVLHRALMEGMHDPATLALLTKALTDRTTLLNSQLDHVTKLQAVVTAMQGGDKAAIKTAREAAKSSMETVEANAKILSEDCQAIREHLKSAPHPGLGRQRTPPGSGSTPGATSN